ncbi:NfeD family protein [Croceicoccus bisphenolivorans]|uniref:NfeD family protein n=1 Tax=Croceicoccus bisphenolivorans TaxID=1783232 RepID=UPI00082C157C|nr:NfeD family protein [Croceicoccus bisphenolivorans]
MDWLSDLDSSWLWLIAGVVMAGIEMIVPGYFLIWLAVAAFVTGLVAAVADISVSIQLVTFIAFAAASVYAAREWLDYAGSETTDPLLNDRGARLVGTGVVVTQAFEGGEGRVRLGDSEWLARGADAPVGTRLVVIGHEGSILLVGPAPANHIAGNQNTLTQD